MIADVPPKNTNDYCFTTEAFCSVFAETALEVANLPEFIDRAVDFVNTTLWGTLTASIIVHPKSLLVTSIATSLEHALVNLHYGTVAINESGGMAFSLVHTGTDIEKAKSLLEQAGYHDGIDVVLHTSSITWGMDETAVAFKESTKC